MALTDCWECGTEVSTAAEACPECGAPDPGRESQEGEGEYEEYDWDWIDYEPPEEEKRSSSSRPSGALVLENPSNGYRKTFRHAGAKTFFTGSLYFLKHGMVGKALMGLFVGIITVGIGWLYLAYKAEDYIADHYQSQGWKEVSK